MDPVLTFAIGFFIFVISYNFITWYHLEIPMDSETRKEDVIIDDFFNDNVDTVNKIYLPCMFPVDKVLFEI